MRALFNMGNSLTIFGNESFGAISDASRCNSGSVHSKGTFIHSFHCECMKALQRSIISAQSPSDDRYASINVMREFVCERTMRSHIYYVISGSYHVINTYWQLHAHGLI